MHRAQGRSRSGRPAWAWRRLSLTPIEVDVAIKCHTARLAGHDPLPIDVNHIPGVPARLDLVYAPGETDGSMPAERGIEAMDGREMLVQQGAAGVRSGFSPQRCSHRGDARRRATRAACLAPQSSSCFFPAECLLCHACSAPRRRRIVCRCAGNDGDGDVRPPWCDGAGNPRPHFGPCRLCADWPAALTWVRSAVWLDEGARPAVPVSSIGRLPRIAGRLGGRDAAAAAQDRRTVRAHRFARSKAFAASEAYNQSDPEAGGWRALLADPWRSVSQRRCVGVSRAGRAVRPRGIPTVGPARAPASRSEL